MGVKKETFPWDDPQEVRVPPDDPSSGPWYCTGQPLPRKRSRVDLSNAPWYCTGQPMPRKRSRVDLAGD